MQHFHDNNISDKLLRPNFCTFKSSPSLLSVVVCLRSSITEACAKKLFQIIASNIDNGEKAIGLEILLFLTKYTYMFMTQFFDDFKIALKITRQKRRILQHWKL